jgi:hypothetical protein
MPRNVTAVLMIDGIAVLAVAIARRLPVIGPFVGGAASA